MGFFDNIGKTISEASHGAIQKGKEMADVVKYNSLISEEEKKAADIFEQLGRKYVEVKGDSPDELFKDYVEAIKASEARVNKYKKKLIELKGITRCPSCGAEVPMGSTFCPSCGAKVIENVQQGKETEKHCSSCGSLIPDGCRFCTSCGKAICENTENEKGE